MWGEPKRAGSASRYTEIRVVAHLWMTLLEHVGPSPEVESHVQQAYELLAFLRRIAGFLCGDSGLPRIAAASARATSSSTWSVSGSTEEEGASNLDSHGGELGGISVARCEHSQRATGGDATPGGGRFRRLHSAEAKSQPFRPPMEGLRNQPGSPSCGSQALATERLLMGIRRGGLRPSRQFAVDQDMCYVLYPFWTGIGFYAVES
jgi:hypothetical protein